MHDWTTQQLDSIHKMLNPRSIAVVGATERMQYGGRFLRAVLRAGETVRVYPVNPRYDELLGVPCYPSVRDLPEGPDLVAIIVPYDQVLPTLRESADRGAGSAVVISAGFAERGLADRRQLQVELGNLARHTGVRVAGPNCLGLANVKDGIWACAASSPSAGIAPGNVGLVCQSGASAFGPFVSRAVGKKLGYSYIISTGNEADLEAPDFVRYLLDDDATRVIALFIEGFKNAKKFLQVARLAAEKGKPLVAIKIGRSELGTRAARSHTAALTGMDEAYDAAFEQYGVIRVSDWDRLLEVSHLLAASPVPRQRGVALISHSGGVCSLTADILGQAGLQLPELSEAARNGINDTLQGFGWAANPADITGHANRDTLVPIMQHMIDEPEVGALVIASSGSDRQAEHIVSLQHRSDKLIAFLYTGNELADSTGIATLKAAQVPVFNSPENLATALSQLQHYYAWRAARLATGFGAAAPMTAAQQQVAARLLPPEASTLSEYHSKQLLAAWDVPVTSERRAATLEEALQAAHDIGFPVVLKVDSPDILHKTEAGAVRLGITDEDELRQAYDEVLGNAGKSVPQARLHGVLVQETVIGGTEVIVGVKNDAQLGPLLLFGTGGIFVEVMRDVSLRVCPITPSDAAQMVQAVKGSRLLQGYRGRPRGDVTALVDVLVRVSHLAVNLSNRIEEMDINPLVVLPEGGGVKALDALITLKAGGSAL